MCAPAAKPRICLAWTQLWLSLHWGVEGAGSGADGSHWGDCYWSWNWSDLGWPPWPHQPATLGNSHARHECNSARLTNETTILHWHYRAGLQNPKPHWRLWQVTGALSPVYWTWTCRKCANVWLVSLKSNGKKFRLRWQSHEGRKKLPKGKRMEKRLLQVLPELLEELAVSHRDASCGRQAHAWLWGKGKPQFTQHALSIACGGGSPPPEDIPVIIRASYISHTGGHRWTSLQHTRTNCVLWSSIFTIMMYLWGWTHWLISGLMLFCMHCMQIALISYTLTLARVHEEDLSIIFLTGHGVLTGRDNQASLPGTMASANMQGPAVSSAWTNILSPIREAGSVGLAHERTNLRTAGIIETIQNAEKWCLD